MEEKYEGWTNRQTWAFKLHIGNNEGDYNYWRERTRENLKSKDTLQNLTTELKEWFEEIFDMVINRENGEPTQEAKLLIQDVGNGDDIDWYEIAQSLIDDFKEDENYERNKGRIKNEQKTKRAIS